MNIDWAQLITKAMKDAAAAALALDLAKAELATRNAVAVDQIVRIKDRVDTLGYGVDIAEASPEDEAELASLTVNLNEWKAYKFALGKVATQPAWPLTPTWPTPPVIAEIAADPTA